MTAIIWPGNPLRAAIDALANRNASLDPLLCSRLLVAAKIAAQRLSVRGTAERGRDAVPGPVGRTSLPYCARQANRWLIPDRHRLVLHRLTLAVHLRWLVARGLTAVDGHDDSGNERGLA